jgi:predicted metal-dependent HD superfamily phosphohydrolase
MRDRFVTPALRHGASADAAERWWRELETRYSEPHRHYHTLRHIEEMLDLLPHADETVVMAVWFHDAIYGGERNEERSAELAREALTELRFPTIETVEQLILATKTHDASQFDRDSARGSLGIVATPAPLSLAAAAADAPTAERAATSSPQSRAAAEPPHSRHEAAAFLDADLAILGSAPARYDEYAAQIRREYAHIPAALFRSGRASLMRAFLARPRIYATEEFRERFEAQARANIERELSASFTPRTG